MAREPLEKVKELLNGIFTENSIEVKVSTGDEEVLTLYVYVKVDGITASKVYIEYGEGVDLRYVIGRSLIDIREVKQIMVYDYVTELSKI